MRHFFFDYETFAIQPGMQAPPPVVMSYAYDREAPRIVHANPAVGGQEFNERLLEALEDPNVTMVAHEAPFEVVVSLAHRPDWVTKIFDKLRAGKILCTIVREKLIRIARGDHREGFALDALLDSWMIPHTIDKSDYWRPRFGLLWDTPIAKFPKAALDYSLGDVAARDAFYAQERSARDLLIDQAQQMRAAVSLKLTSCWGFPVDREAATALYRETEEILDQYRADLVRAGMVRVERKKGQTVYVRDRAAAEAQMVKACAATGRPVKYGELTEKMEAKGRTQGNIVLDEEACLLTGDPLLLAYTRYGQASGLLSKIRRLQNPLELIQTSYNSLVNTGRTSSRQGDDPAPGEAPMAYGMQVQNLPRAGEEYEDEDGKKHNRWGARECFVAPGYTEWLKKWGSFDPATGRTTVDPQCYLDHPPEWVIISVDFDAFEMRTWAQCCVWMLGKPNCVLWEILNNAKRCPHIEMGTRIEGQWVDAPSWEQQYAWGYGLKKSDPKRLKGVRNLAKGPNFGLPGGMAYLRLMDYCRLGYGVVLDEEKAQLICAVWREMYPEAQPYLDEVKERLKLFRYGSRGTMEQFVSKRIRGDVGFCDGANGFFQGLASDAAKNSGIELMYEAYERVLSPFYGSRPLAFVHDEWLYAVRRSMLHEAGHRMRDVQVGAAQPYCPDVMLTASPAGFYRWSKAAGDPVYLLPNSKLSTNPDGGARLIAYEEKAAYV